MLVDDLILGKSLGKGSFGEVFLTKKVNGTQKYATKRMDRAEYEKPENNKRLMNEISILRKINHPNIVKLIEVKKTRSHIYIVTEFCNGGSLTDNLNKYIQKNRKAFSEEIVQYIMKQICSAIYYLHKNKIIHRDLKLDNILMNFPSEIDKVNLNLLKAEVKLIDFGFATKLRESNGNLTQTILGTPSNMEPHMLRDMENHRHSISGYNEKVDIWSLGTLCYEMLVGTLTFAGRSMEELYEKVKKGTYKLPLWLSKEAVSFINGMLQYDENKRLSAGELLKHDFLTKNVKDFQKVNVEEVKGNVQGKMMKVNIMKNTVIWNAFNNDNNNNNSNDKNITQNFQTMPNIEYNENILKKNQTNIKYDKSDKNKKFAEVRKIDKKNNIEIGNNNIQMHPAQRPISNKNNQKPNFYPPHNRVPQTANHTNHFYKQQTFEKNEIKFNENINKIQNNESHQQGLNYTQYQQHDNKEKSKQFKKQMTFQNESNPINYEFNTDSFPTMSQMEDYCKDKTQILNEFY